MKCNRGTNHVPLPTHADGTPGYSVSAQMVADFHAPQQKDDADDVEG